MPSRASEAPQALVRICKPLQRPDWRQILLQTSFGREFFALSPKRRLMNTYLPLILTTIVAISTIIYTVYSIQLWRTTRAAAEISRQAALGHLWAELNRYLEILRRQDAPETAFLQKVSNLLSPTCAGSCRLSLREGQAPSGPAILDQRGPVQIYWESTEAIPPSRNRPRHPPIWAARF